MNEFNRFQDKDFNRINGHFHHGDSAVDEVAARGEIVVRDTVEYGRYAAQMLQAAARSVAIAPVELKLAVFGNAADNVVKAVMDQWLPKNRAIDRLIEIAGAHNCFGAGREKVESIIADAFVCRQAATAPSNRIWTPPRRGLIVRRASDLQPEKLEWIWPGRIAQGKLVLLGGPPGLGKSQLTAFIAAQISNGGDWPCGEGSAPIGSVIILSAEDGVADTIVPRLIAAGAERHRIHIIEAATKPDGSGRKTFSLKTDVDLLERLATQIQDVRLTIIDPVSAYMGGADGNGNVETRAVLEPLAEMANRRRIAVVAVTHLNKGGSGGNQSALNRFAGSIAFVAAARAAFAVIEDPDSDERRLLLQAKNNLGKKCHGLAFRLEQRVIADSIVSSNVMFEGAHVSKSIDEALSASENRGMRKGQFGSRDEIMQFLKDTLSSGPVDVLEVERQARAAALLEENQRINKSKVFRDARKALGVTSSREGYGPGSRFVLALPQAALAP